MITHLVCEVLGDCLRYRTPFVIAFLSVIPLIPAISSGLVGDDYLFQAILQDLGPLSQGTKPDIMHIYDFIPGGLSQSTLQSQGMLSWWADPELRISLFRPLTVLTFLLDQALFTENYVIQHLHSLLWYAFGVLVISFLYHLIIDQKSDNKKWFLLSPPVLASLMFAFDDVHTMSAGWIANRHVLVSLVTGGLMVYCHWLWWQSQKSIFSILALTLLILGLGISEGSLGALAYVIAWELVFTVSLKKKISHLIPYFLIVVLWRIVYNYLGYGIFGSGLYIDPINNPIEFMLSLIFRLPLLMVAQWSGISLDPILLLNDNLQLIVGFISIFLTIGIIIYLWPLLKKSALARFWAFGSVLSAVPLCAAFPMDRLLVFTGVGAFGLLALQVYYSGWIPNTEVFLSKWRRYVTAGFLIINLPFSILMMSAKSSFGLPLFGTIFNSGAQAQKKGEIHFYLNGHEFPVLYSSIIPYFENRNTPEKVALLAPVTEECLLERTGSHRIVIICEDGWLDHPMNRLERSLELPFVVGETYRSSEFKAKILEITEDGDAKKVEFILDKPVGSAEYKWWFWGEKGLTKWEPISINEKTVLTKQSLMSM